MKNFSKEEIKEILDQGNTKELKDNQRRLYAPMVKNPSTGQYFCVLSDDSVDRDDEIVGKKLFKKAIEEDWLPAHLNHDFRVQNLIAEWQNKRIKKVKGHNALVADPKWFMSNPASSMVKGMLDEGAKIGISIVAIPTSFEDVEREGKEVTKWTDGEILAGDFVTIPANKHANALRIAKSFNASKKELEDDTMKEEEREAMVKDITKDVTSEVKKSFESFATDLKKDLLESIKKEEEKKDPPAEPPADPSAPAEGEGEDKGGEEGKSKKGDLNKRSDVLNNLNKGLPNKEGMPETKKESEVGDDVSANAFIKAYQPSEVN